MFFFISRIGKLLDYANLSFVLIPLRHAQYIDEFLWFRIFHLYIYTIHASSYTTLL